MYAGIYRRTKGLKNASKWHYVIKRQVQKNEGDMKGEYAIQKRKAKKIPMGKTPGNCQKMD